MSKILMIIILILGLGATLFLVSQRTGFFSKATIGGEPKEIRITNISDNSLTVSWVTEKAVQGFVNYGEKDSLGKTSGDDRDSAGPQARLTHHITLKKVTPSTTYYFKIGSGDKIYDNGGKVWSQVTAPTTSKPPAVPTPIFGKVQTSDGKIPAEALVFLSVGDSTTLSSYIRADGNWLITLNNARTKDLSNYISISKDDLVDLLAVGGSGNQVQLQSSAEGNVVTLTLPYLPENYRATNAFDWARYVKQKLGL